MIQTKIYRDRICEPCFPSLSRNSPRQPSPHPIQKFISQIGISRLVSKLNGCDTSSTILLTTRVYKLFETRPFDPIFNLHKREKEQISLSKHLEERTFPMHYIYRLMYSLVFHKRLLSLYLYDKKNGKF